MNIVSSSRNPLIKEVRSLKNKKYREEKNLFFIEGARFIEEAIMEKAEIERVFISERHFASIGGSYSKNTLPYNSQLSTLFATINNKGYETFIVPDRLFNEISDTESPQGILAVIKTKHYSLEKILGESNFLIILDSVQDPGNVGTIIRTADAAGFTGIILSKGSVDIYNPKVLRSTMGSVFRIPICISHDLVQSIHLLLSKGIRVYAAHLKGRLDYFDADMGEKLAIVIGNEANGISDEVSSIADALIKIPMLGGTESLNASVAAGILMYETIRQRLKRKIDVISHD